MAPVTGPMHIHHFEFQGRLLSFVTHTALRREAELEFLTLENGEPPSMSRAVQVEMRGAGYILR